MGPVTSYESVGDVDKVIFPNGWVLDHEADQLQLYYGAGDSVVGLATARFSEVMAYVKQCPLYHHRRVSDDGTVLNTWAPLSAVAELPGHHEGVL
jgi:hypothetical protein